MQGFGRRNILAETIGWLETECGADPLSAAPDASVDEEVDAIELVKKTTNARRRFDERDKMAWCLSEEYVGRCINRMAKQSPIEDVVSQTRQARRALRAIEPLQAERLRTLVDEQLQIARTPFADLLDQLLIEYFLWSEWFLPDPTDVPHIRVYRRQTPRRVAYSSR